MQTLIVGDLLPQLDAARRLLELLQVDIWVLVAEMPQQVVAAEKATFAGDQRAGALLADLRALLSRHQLRI